MVLSDNGAANAHYHRDRARIERQAAARTQDERARRAHLELAMQHEIAMFRACIPRPTREEDLRPGQIGATLRAVIAFPDAGSSPAMRIDGLVD